MSQSQPNPEERQRMVDDVVQNKLNKDWLPKPPKTDLEVLREKQNSIIFALVTTMSPICQFALECPATDPRFAHREQGRGMLYSQAIRLAVDKVKELSREELIFLLSLEYGMKVVDSRIG